MFDSLTKIFEGKNIHQKMTLRNQLKNVKIQNAETIQSYFTRVSQIKEQIESGKRRSEECRSGDSHLKWSPWIIEFIHSRNVCQKEVITFNRLWEEEEEAHLIRREEERWEQLKIKLSPFKEDPSSDEEYEEVKS